MEGFNIINAPVNTLIPTSAARAHRIVVPGADGSICTVVEACDGHPYLEDDQAIELELGWPEDINLNVV